MTLIYAFRKLLWYFTLVRFKLSRCVGPTAYSSLSFSIVFLLKRFHISFHSLWGDLLHSTKNSNTLNCNWNLNWKVRTKITLILSCAYHVILKYPSIFFIQNEPKNRHGVFHAFDGLLPVKYNITGKLNFGCLILYTRFSWPSSLNPSRRT